MARIGAVTLNGRTGAIKLIMDRSSFWLRYTTNTSSACAIVYGMEKKLLSVRSDAMDHQNLSARTRYERDVIGFGPRCFWHFLETENRDAQGLVL